MTHGFKTKKALMKRVKITSRGKLLKLRPNQNHFNAKDSGNATRGKRGDKAVPDSLAKDARQLLQGL
ncbi:MAG: 50S ribosomal protein L35 [Candidatus Yanofskybacteria bacterium]|nr:50S ribosomal protein L35 [Candidatus Yanofskybacteria bacterium]